MAVLRWSGHEEIVQGQRKPSKMVGAGVVAAQCWSHCGEIPHIQGQRRSPRKMEGGVNSHLESNTIPIKMLRGLKRILCARGPRDPTETETELCLSISSGDTGEQWTATVTGALGAADLDMA